MQFFLGALVALFLLPVFGFAGELSGCKASAPVLEYIRHHRRFEREQRYTDLPTMQRANSFFNRNPPPSNETFDAITFVGATTGAVVLYFGKGARFCGAVTVPAENAEFVRRLILNGREI